MLASIKNVTVSYAGTNILSDRIVESFVSNKVYIYSPSAHPELYIFVAIVLFAASTKGLLLGAGCLFRRPIW